jgi:hypothetical protein
VRFAGLQLDELSHKRRLADAGLTSNQDDLPAGFGLGQEIGQETKLLFPFEQHARSLPGTVSWAAPCAAVSHGEPSFPQRARVGTAGVASNKGVRWQIKPIVRPCRPDAGLCMVRGGGTMREP